MGEADGLFGSVRSGGGPLVQMRRCAFPDIPRQKLQSAPTNQSVQNSHSLFISARLSQSNPP